MRLLGKKHHVVAEINMIPFIDISLVLLIIFMVMTPFLVQSQLRVQLPKATVDAPSEERAVTVQVLSNGSFVIKNHTVTAERLEQEMSLLLPKPEKQSLLIQADKDTAFQHVVTAMDAARRLRVGKMGVAILPKEK